MNRQEFCKILKCQREYKKITKSDVARRIGEMFHVVDNIEKAKYSSNMNLILRYVSAIESTLTLNGKQFSTHEELVDLFKIERKKSGTQDNFAKICGVSRVTVSKIENEQSSISVDVFLNMCTSLKIKIEIVNKECAIESKDQS
ncbi:helix-turn-helix domain-containing protein [Falsiporphyromonas endometrii]|uniref:Helix-turn-helix domain-containing protein n=1 Tax=Falsiporphyromonas endometrii TaxID=1387297 RepID=A0ABV9K929_9PORP